MTPLYRLKVAMRIAIIVIVFLLTAFAAVAQTASTLRQKYGQPTSETYKSPPTSQTYNVRSEIKVTVSYTKSGDVCEMYIEPVSQTTDGKESVMKSQPLEDVIDELVPDEQRGKFVLDTNFTCVLINGPVVTSCSRVEHKYQRLTISMNGNTDAHPSASIKWKNRKCAQPR